MTDVPLTDVAGTTTMRCDAGMATSGAGSAGILPASRRRPEDCASAGRTPAHHPRTLISSLPLGTKSTQAFQTTESQTSRPSCSIVPTSGVTTAEALSSDRAELPIPETPPRHPDARRGPPARVRQKSANAIRRPGLPAVRTAREISRCGSQRYRLPLRITPAGLRSGVETAPYRGSAVKASLPDSGFPQSRSDPQLAAAARRPLLAGRRG